MSRVHAPRLLVVGLDGATLDLVRPWAAEGYLPTLARLMAEGAAGPLRSTVPPVTAPAWISFMTGRSPARHGIFQFRTYDLTRYTCYDETLVTSRAFAGTTLFDLAGAAGLRVAALNVPMTYPPFPVNGVMVSGYPTPDVRRPYTYPPGLAAGLGPMNVTGEVFRHTHRQRLRSAAYMVETLTALCERLLRQEPFDLLTVVYTNTDMANHFFRRYMDPSLPVYDRRGARRYGTVVRDQYALCDRALGRLLAAVGEETTVVVLSDHGSGPSATRLVHLNAWLRQEGWLAVAAPAAARTGEGLRAALEWVRIHTPFLREALKRSLPDRLKAWISWGRQNAGAVDWSRTVAYRVPMAFEVEGVNVNLRGRQRQGVVPPERYEAVREAVAARLRTLRDPATGQPVVRAVCPKEEVYPGGDLSRAPDLIVFLDPRYTGGGGVVAAPVTDVPRYHLRTWSGQHAMDGLLVMRGPAVRPGVDLTGARIVDVAPTLLYLLGLPVPADMDGQVLTEALRPDRLAAAPVAAGPSVGAPRDGGRALAPEEEAEMRDALRALGYLT